MQTFIHLVNPPPPQKKVLQEKKKTGSKMCNEPSTHRVSYKFEGGEKTRRKRTAPIPTVAPCATLSVKVALLDRMKSCMIG
jgi:hypothetical protein